jgi:hypothetical protein
MPGRGELAQALYGSWRLARLDRHGMQYFDLSHHGVWRSFWSAAFCYPGFLILLFLRLDPASLARSSIPHIVLVESIGYVVAWTAFPLLILGLCRSLRREDEGFDFIVAYNWSQILQTGFLLVVALVADRLLPQGAASGIDLLAYLLLLAYEWFIALVAIGAGGWVAAAVVFVDVVLGSFVLAIADSLY